MVIIHDGEYAFKHASLRTFYGSVLHISERGVHDGNRKG